MTRVLIVDDDPVHLRLTTEIARKAGFSPVTAVGGEEALRLLRTDPGIAVMILDLVMPDRDGMAVMEAMAREQIAVPVIVQTAHSGMETVVSATRQGAVDFFVKPVAPERLIVSLRNVLRLGELQSIVRTERARRAGTLGLGDLVSRSPTMERPLGLIQKAARTSLPILIEGEAGTGKQRAARIIHAAGERASKPFVAIHCDGLDAAALDAALFGGTEPGKLVEADGGTLYLSEIGVLPAALQAKLLEVLETGEMPRAAATRPVRVNIRLIASASHRLLGLARSREFNEGLYNRLNVLPIYLPPLRDRIEDIVPLAIHFATRFAAELGKPFGAFTPAALELLRAHDWPGNILELENAVFRALALADGGDPDIADFPQILALHRGRAEAVRIAAALPLPSAPVHIDTARPRPYDNQPEAAADRFIGDNGEVIPLDIVERELIAFALARYGGHMSRVARALRIGRSTLYRKLREYGLEEPLDSDAA
jgi:DNA-binding NtrC family response regulator